MAEIATNENIECPGGMPAFLAYPKAAGRYPVVVLMHERYGLVAHAKDLARRCAADGYVVLAPNFFFKHPDQKALNAGNERYDMTDSSRIRAKSRSPVIARAGGTRSSWPRRKKSRLWSSGTVQPQSANGK